VNRQCPQQRSGVLLEMIGPEEAFLYNPAVEAMHVLNFTALTVWNKCDGSHSIAEISSHLRTICQCDNVADVENDVQKIVGTFAELGVLA
jgi:hypothetical protein